MPTIRTRKAKRGEVLRAAAGTAALLCLLWNTPIALAEEPAATQPRELDAEAHARIVVLRKQLQLPDTTLAAIGVDQSDAEGILSCLLSWHEANQTAWLVRRAAAARAQKAVRGTLSDLSVSASSADVRSRLQQLRAAAAAARQQEEDLLAGLRQQIEAGLTDSQKAVWATIRANPASAGQYVCAPNLRAAQLTALRAAHTRHARQHITADTDAARSAAATALARAERSILTDTQRTALAIASTNLRRHLPAVLAASQKVLPRPEEPDDGRMVQPTAR